MKLLRMILLIGIPCFAQVGIGTTNPNTNSLLELSATNKGFLIARVALSDITLATPTTAHVAGMIVFNTATAGSAPNNVTPGLYCNNGTIWEKLGATGTTAKQIGRERINTSNGTFIRVGSDAVWNNFAAAGTPAFTTKDIWAPFGGTTSFITIVPATSATDFDSFTCTKNITSLRFYTEMQVSIASTGRWRTNLFLNGVGSGTSQYWGAPPNNIGNVRVFGVLEFEAIAAGTNISVKIDASQLSGTSLQNANSYFVIEYEL